MTVYLVRHGDAGDRHRWGQPEDLRPLSARGRAEATALAAILARKPVTRILSSRYARCVQTVEPLAALVGVEVEHDDALAEEARPRAVADLVERVAADDAVLCTHGNIVPVVLEHLTRQGVTFDDPPQRCAKASTWVLTAEGARYTRAHYLPRPR